jgi:hypothetical protein
MTTPTITPYRSGQRPGHDGFGQLLRAEWAKFRTVRGWVLSLVAAALVAAAATVAPAAVSNGKTIPAANPHAPVGPAGTAVTDSFYFVHRELAGNGSITARVTSLADRGPQGEPAGFVSPAPWAKAGVLIKASTRPGSAYAAIMVTLGHGVRFQYDFTHDTAGLPGTVSASSPRWLRLTRRGDTVTGYDSVNGTQWTLVGTARLAGLPVTAQAGLFAASPGVPIVSTQSVGMVNTSASAVFDHVGLGGMLPTRGGAPPDPPRPGRTWHGAVVGQQIGSVTTGCHSGDGHVTCNVEPRQMVTGGVTGSAGAFRLTGGGGDIAPYVSDVDPLWVAFKGSLFGLIAVVALGALFITAEYRRGMIRTTLTASPRRGRVLVAKAIVIGTVSFAAGLAGAAAAFPLTVQRLGANGWVRSVYPAWSIISATGLRVVLGTAALLAVAAVLALAAGAVFRQSAAAITAVIALLILPVLLTFVLPVSLAQSLLRITPAAAFALQQGVTRYPQVISVCRPDSGCYPLAPWTGFAVLCGYALVALAVAVYLVRRRDA